MGNASEERKAKLAAIRFDAETGGVQHAHNTRWLLAELERAEAHVGLLRGTLRWMRQTVHQAPEHQGEPSNCPRNTCRASTHTLATTEPKP